MDSYLNVNTVVRVLTFGIFVVLGFDLSKSIPRPRSVYSWFVMVATIIVVALFGVRVPPVKIWGIEVFLDVVLLGSCVGFISGFIVRLYPTIRLRKF